MQIRKIQRTEKKEIDDIVSIHLATFQGFFLAFMGRGFLNQMYRSYCDHYESGLLAAFEDGKPIGFLAYSGNMSGLYKFMIKKRLIPFTWYSLGAFCRKPKVFMRLIRAFLKPGESKREEKYLELSSIGVDTSFKSKGIGSALITALKKNVNSSDYAYISLETDAENNDAVNGFYRKNGFVLARVYEAYEGRKMNEYHYKEEHYATH